MTGRSVSIKKVAEIIGSRSEISDKNHSMQEEDFTEDEESSYLSSHFKVFNIGLLNEAALVDIQVFKSEAHLYTIGWLSEQVKTKLEIECYSKEIICSKNFDSFFILQTKSKQIMYDYLLTIPETTLDKLPDKLELIPFSSTLKSKSFNPLLKQKKTSISDFEIYAKLGRGGFSTVYVGNK